MKILFDNLMLISTLSAASPNDSYPLANLKHSFLKKIYKSTTNYDIITMTWDEDQTIDCCYVGHTNAKSFMLSLYDENSTLLYSKRFSSDAMGVNFTAVAGVRSATLYLCNFLETTIYLGSIGVGINYAMPDPIADWSPDSLDNSTRVSSSDGQILINKIPKLQKIGLNFRIFTYLLFQTIKSYIDDIDQPVFIDCFEKSHGALAPIALYDNSAMADVPGIPDNAAETTYKSNFASSIDSFTAIGATLSYASNKLVATATATTVKIIRAVTSATLRTIRINYNSPRAGTVYIYGTVAGTTDTLIGTFTYTDARKDQLLNCYVAGALTNVYTSQDGITIGDVIYISVLYVGNGSYTSPLVDNSGDGLNLSLFGGVLPVSNGLQFNGSTSYLKSANVLTSIPDVMTFGIKMPNGHAFSPTYQAFANYGLESSGKFFYIARIISADNLFFRYFNGSVATSVIFDSFFTGYSATEIDMFLAVNWSSFSKTFTDAQGNSATIPGYGVMAFRNGVQFGATQYMTTPVKPLPGEVLHALSYQGTQYFINGVIGEIMVLDYLPTTAQMLLAQNGELFNPINRHLPIYGTFDGDMQSIKKGDHEYDFTLTALEAR
jgi:hypothetical protein